MRYVAQFCVKRCRRVHLSISEECGAFGVTTYLLTNNACVRQTIGGCVSRLSNFNGFRSVCVVR